MQYLNIKITIDGGEISSSLDNKVEFIDLKATAENAASLVDDSELRDRIAGTCMQPGLIEQTFLKYQ